MQPRSSGRTCSLGGRTHDRSAGNLAARGDASARRASAARRGARAGGAGRNLARGSRPYARRTRSAACKRAAEVAAMAVRLEAGNGCRGDSRGSAVGSRTGTSRRTRAAGRDPGGETLGDFCGLAEGRTGRSGIGRLATDRLATPCLAGGRVAIGCVAADCIGTICEEAGCIGGGQSGECAFRRRARLARWSERRAQALRPGRCGCTRCGRSRGRGEGTCGRTGPGHPRARALPDGSCTDAARCSGAPFRRVRSAGARGRGTRVAAELAEAHCRAAANGTRRAGRRRAREVPRRLSRRAGPGGGAEEVNRVCPEEATSRLPRPRSRSSPRRSRWEHRGRGRSRCA